jgi:uncharacterized repeat protein (TIGR03803 family)
VFRVSTNGGLNTLAAFNQTNGAFPMAGLVRATNGQLYGTTSTGGASGLGTVFSMTSDGAVTTLRDFAGGVDGASPSTLLLQATDGNLYGSASGGGAAGFGTIFRIKLDSTFSTVYSFTGGADSGSPGGALLDVTGGDLFGLTPTGGAFDQGRVFRLTPSGSLSTAYSFTGGTDGYEPVGALVQGDNGSLFGVTRLAKFRGFTFYGTIFKLDANGTLNTLYMLNFSDGALPAAGLVMGSDGNFYGTTEQGGANDNGTVFRITPSGAFSTLVEFDGFNDGFAPLAALTQGLDGSLYGTTSKGGVGGFGTIFKLAFNGPPQITQQPVGQLGTTGGAIRFSVAVSGGSPLSYLWRKDGTNLTETAFVNGASARVLTLSNLTLNDSGSYSVTVTNALGKVTSAAAQLTIKAAPPSFQSVSQSDGSLLLTWSTTPGHNYQLQSKLDLVSGAWTNLGSPATATGTSLQTSVFIGPAAYQLYRVIMLP